MTKRLPLGNRRGEHDYTLVDDDVYEWASKLPWHRGSKGYVYTSFITRKQTKHLNLARLIVGARPWQVPDHINGDPSDNRRENLRACSQSQNSMNRVKTPLFKGRPTSSRYKGVFWDNAVWGGGKWRACITVRGKRIYLGCHETEQAAARAYDKAAREYHGEFSVLNLG